MKIAIFGGSFNPVHCGHISIAKEVIRIGYQKILFIPVSIPPHKILARGAGDADRIAMLKLALQDFLWAELWKGELHRNGPSYSIDTVRELRRNGILDSRAAIIIGDDLADNFSSWKDAPKLIDEVDIILARREVKREVEFQYPCFRLLNTPVPHSSSEIRQMIGNGLSIGKLVPLPVAEYIRRNRLYGFAQT